MTHGYQLYLPPPPSGFSDEYYTNGYMKKTCRPPTRQSISDQDPTRDKASIGQHDRATPHRHHQSWHQHKSTASYLSDSLVTHSISPSTVYCSDTPSKPRGRTYHYIDYDNTRPNTSHTRYRRSSDGTTTWESNFLWCPIAWRCRSCGSYDAPIPTLHCGTATGI